MEGRMNWFAGRGSMAQARRPGRAGPDLAGYKRLFEQAFDGAMVLDVADGRIHLANQRAAEMLGHALENLSGKTIFDLHFPGDLDRSARRIADAWLDGGLVYEDIPFRHADGSAVEVECSVKVSEQLGRPAVVIYLRDIRERLRLQREVAERNMQVERQNEEMQSSLRYASGIQQAMLPSPGQLRAAFGDAFVIHRPRDIVSGDFHWCTRTGSRSMLAVADCTGHGVPGALLTMTGITLLRQITEGRGLHEPAEVLAELRQELLRTLVHQEDEGQLHDGMDIAFLTWDRLTGECLFSGALSNMHLVRADGTPEEVKGDRVPIGWNDGKVRPFTQHALQLAPGDRVFLCSDGWADQFGGPEGRKLKASGLKAMLQALPKGALCGQGKSLEQRFTAWKGTLDQVDDVTLVGFQA